MVLLVTSDNEQFNADKEVVERSVLIKNMLEGSSVSLPILVVCDAHCYRCRRV